MKITCLLSQNTSSSRTICAKSCRNRNQLWTFRNFWREISYKIRRCLRKSPDWWSSHFLRDSSEHFPEFLQHLAECNIVPSATITSQAVIVRRQSSLFFFPFQLEWSSENFLEIRPLQKNGSTLSCGFTIKEERTANKFAEVQLFGFHATHSE